MEVANLQKRVETVFEKIRPYLREDDGDVEYVRYEPETRSLVIRFLGNCDGCPMSIMTLRAGIERFILKEIPEIKRLEQEK